MGFRQYIAKKAFMFLTKTSINNATSSSRDLEATKVARVGMRQGDITSKEFEDAEYDLTEITAGYNADSYIRQGVDKYVDQIFKEGYGFYGKNEQATEYIKSRFTYIAECTQTSTDQLFTEIAEDVVKYGNCFLAKSRSNDVNLFPQGATIQGVYGGDAVAGYFPINATTITLKRDKDGTIIQYKQTVGSEEVTFNPEDIVHFPYKREKGNAFGTPILWPVLDDVRSLRQAEENVLRMMYRNIYPFYHVVVGTDEIPGGSTEIDEVKEQIEGMTPESGLVTSNRVNIKAIASDQVINAEPYLTYMENRVFSGMGMSAIMFGRGDTANRSTGDNITSEMSDRIKAIQKTIESIVNDNMIKELLLEGGFDPLLNPDDTVYFAFKENDMDAMVKAQTHTIFKFEHNAITEDEMREELNMDPIADADRVKLCRQLTADMQIYVSQNTATQTSNSTGEESGSGSKKETQQKQTPTNQHGTKTSSKKSIKNNEELLLLMDEVLNAERRY